MTDEQPQPHDPHAESPQQPPHQPNWGSAYPPPGQQAPGYPPPGGQYPPYGQGYPPPGYGYPPYAQAPKHESATTALVLGLVGTTGAVACYLPVFVAPFAWFIGAKTLREIDASRGALSGRSEAKAGMILGIIGTVMMILALCAAIVLIILSLTVHNFWGGDNYAEYDENSIDAAIGAFMSLRR